MASPASANCQGATLTRWKHLNRWAEQAVQAHPRLRLGRSTLRRAATAVANQVHPWPIEGSTVISSYPRQVVRRGRRAALARPWRCPSRPRCAGLHQALGAWASRCSSSDLATGQICTRHLLYLPIRSAPNRAAALLVPTNEKPVIYTKRLFLGRRVECALPLGLGSLHRPTTGACPLPQDRTRRRFGPADRTFCAIVVAQWNWVPLRGFLAERDDCVRPMPCGWSTHCPWHCRTHLPPWRSV